MIKELSHYKDYVGQYVKRFYTPFDEESIWKIKDHALHKGENIKGEEFEYNVFLYSKEGEEDWWTDCEDSCIITNELPIKNIDWVANVNDKDYKGYNSFNS